MKELKDGERAEVDEASEGTQQRAGGSQGSSYGEVAMRGLRDELAKAAWGGERPLSFVFPACDRGSEELGDEVTFGFDLGSELDECIYQIHTVTRPVDESPPTIGLPEPEILDRKGRRLR